MKVPALVGLAEALEAQANAAGPNIDASELDMRILQARNPGAAREMGEGRKMAAKGAEAFEAWLARPVEYEAVDPARLQEYLLELLGVAMAEAKAADAKSGKKAVLYERAIGLFRELRQHMPDERISPEEIAKAKIDQLHAETLELIEEYTSRQEELAAEPRAGAPFGRCVTCDAPLSAPLDPAPVPS